jgi:tRNA (guanine37-N1)-methyltransferase
VNKLNTIHAEYRYFDMEVLAGDHDFVTTVVRAFSFRLDRTALLTVQNESTCSFTFDFRHVYWNSRLHHEHERLVSLFSPGQVVADVMAGVGPFAIPAAKKGCYVFGNDLNPESVRWMRENRRKNHVGVSSISFATFAGRTAGPSGQVPSSEQTSKELS